MDYKGFELFNDLEDQFLRNQNRGVVLANIAEDNAQDQRISNRGAMLILGYFASIPEEDRDEVRMRFANTLRQRGWKIDVVAN